jgi:hypothetical protein
LEAARASDPAGWKVLLPRTRLGPGAQHFFTLSEGQLNNVNRYGCRVL